MVSALFLWQYHFNYYSLVVYFEVSQCKVFDIILFAQDCFGHSGFLMIPFALSILGFFLLWEMLLEFC
jgi:hypothetical protein